MKNLDAKKLNQNCQCQCQGVGSPFLIDISADRPHLFSSTVYFLDQNHFNSIKQFIHDLEKLLAQAHFQKEILRDLPLVNQQTKGVMMGYDFHITENGPQLIEINTNAGGALLNLELARSHLNYNCSDGSQHTLAISPEEIEEKIYQMFLNEWKLYSKNKPLNLIAIVDQDPKAQFLYPEFLLFQKLFKSHGTDAIITDPNELEFQDGKLYYHGQEIDLVYNRLTDFYLLDDKNILLKKAYDENSSLITPSPLHHALYANKANLALLTQDKFNHVTSFIPKTVLVTKENATQLWAMKKDYFFKPVAGYGSKAAYRGDKITHRVWEEILAHAYIAQKFIPPEERIIILNGEKVTLKTDLRAYTYNGEILLLSARLYSGQTTNFRTLGGGFAPVIVI